MLRLLHTLFSITIFLSTIAYSIEINASYSQGAYETSSYVRSPEINEELWNTLTPYFLPAHFPEKAILDAIFSERRVLSSLKSLTKSGFVIISNPKNKTIVAKHPYLKDYLVKVYLDSMDSLDWYWWKKRVDGANLIQRAINAHGYWDIMKTPKKWIYPLPPTPRAKEGAPYPKHFILLVEEMDVLSDKKNREAYKKKMTPTILDALYTLIMDNLLIDSVYADNVPFCKDGKLAFIDTEHTQDTSLQVPITLVAQFLSSEMHLYWEQLIVNGGPHY